MTAGREETNRNENGPTTAATTEGEKNRPAAGVAVLGAPPRSADLISLMRQKFSTAIPGEEEEEGGSSGGAPAAGQRLSHTDFGTKPGTDSELRTSFFLLDCKKRGSIKLLNLGRSFLLFDGKKCPPPPQRTEVES